MKSSAATIPKIHLYQEQADFIYDPCEALAFVAGIGSGKSYAGAVRALLASQGRLAGQEIQIPNTGMVTAPTYRMLKDASWRTFLQIARPHIDKINKSEMTILMNNGSEVFFRTASEPDNLRGPNLTWWWGDEAAYYAPEVQLVMIGRLREHGDGYYWLTSTPKGRNWMWRDFGRDQAGYKCYSVPTWKNPFLTDKYIRSLLTKYTGDYAYQEIEGGFVSFQGLIYPEFDRGLHTRSVMPEQFKEVFAGVDWGYSNAGVIQVGGIDFDNRLWILHEEYVERRLIEDWVRVAQQLQETWHISILWCDPSEPDYIRKMRDKGLNAVGANNTVSTGIQAVKNRLVRQPDGMPRLLLNKSAVVHTPIEFEQYHWRKMRDGHSTEEPVKSNDHALDSLRYLVMGIDGGQRSAPNDTGAASWAG